MKGNDLFNILDNIILSKASANGIQDKDLSGIVILKGAKCNFSCDYCFANNCKNDPFSKIVIEPDKLKLAFNELKSKDKLILGIYAGEPLYNREAFISLCNIINTELPNAKIAINTNGSLLDDWWVDFFIDHKVHTNISHDGPGQKYRGFDFLESEKHIKVIQRLQKLGNLNDFSTVIHKYNCSFSNIYNFFINAQNKTGIIPKNYNFIFVQPDLKVDIPYNFSYMDKDLINYIYDNLRFLLKNSLETNQNTVYSGMHKDLLNYFKKIIYKEILTCAGNSFRIDSSGQKICFKSYFNKQKDSLIRKDHIERCLSCKERRLCPFSYCEAMQLNDTVCSKIKDFILTVDWALNNILENYETLYTIR